MAKLVIVYRARPDEVSRIMAILQRRNMDPVVLDDIGKMGAYRDHSHEVRVAVPETQRDTALGVLAEMEKNDQVRLAPQTKTANQVLFLMIAALGFVAIVTFLDQSGKYVAAVWILLTLVVAVGLVRHAWRKKPSIRRHR